MTPHEHDSAAVAGRRRPLAVVLAISAAILVVEVVGAVVSGSLALLADAGHVLTDVAGLTLALVAAILASRPATPERTWGYRRAEVLAAAAQAAVLFSVGVFILVEGVRRLIAPPPVQSGLMFVFAAVALVGNCISIGVLTRVQSGNLNTRAAFLEVVNDALGSLGVLVAAVLVGRFGWLRADPVVSIGIGLLILPRTWKLLRETVDVLLEGTPKSVDLSAVRAHLLEVEHIVAIHDVRGQDREVG